MTAKELKEQALTEPLHLASYYRFNEEQLKNFCQQLCKEQREIDEQSALEEREKDFPDFRTLANTIKNNKMPEL